MQSSEQAAQVLEKPDSGLDIKRYIQAVLRFKYFIALVTILVTTLVAIYLKSLAPVYQATASLLFNDSKVRTVSVKQVYSENIHSRTYHRTQIQILRSRKIAEQAIQKFSLYGGANSHVHGGELSLKEKLKNALPFLKSNTKTEFTDEELAQFSLDRKIKLFQQALTINQVSWTNIVSVSFEYGDPKIAAEVANMVVEEYIALQLSLKAGVTDKASSWLNTRMLEVKEKLAESEQNLNLFRNQNNIVNIKRAVNQIDEETGLVASQLADAKNELIKLKAITDIKGSLEGTVSIQQLSHFIKQNNSIESAKLLSEAELKVNELSKVYGYKHPKMITAESQLSAIKRQFDQEVSEVMASNESAIKQVKKRIERLEVSLADSRSRYQQISSIEFEYDRLFREVQANTKLYEQFLTRAKETEATNDFGIEPARIFEYARVPQWPIKPNKKKFLILTIFACIAITVGLALLLEITNNTYKSAKELESDLGQQVLGVIPKVKLKKNQVLDTYHYFDSEFKAFTESVRTFRTNLTMVELGKKAKIIEVTSSVPGEGKSTTSANLAFSLSQIEKVLLIDADLRKPSLGPRFSLERFRPGLANAILGIDDIESCIYEDKKSGISIMPAGQVPANPLELFYSPEFEALLGKLSEKYDRIVIDTAPIQAVSDSLVISKLVDEVIYVVKTDGTKTELVKNGVARLLQSKAKVMGVVLNHFDVDVHSKVDAAYGYYDYYGYGEDRKSA